MFPGCDSQYDYSNHIDNINFTDSWSIRTYNFSYVWTMFEWTWAFDIQLETNTGSTNTGSTNTWSISWTWWLNFTLDENWTFILNPSVENKFFESTCTISWNIETCKYNFTRTTVYNVLDSFMFIIFIFLIYKVWKTILLWLVWYLWWRSSLDRYKL
jgi:hypothetical protein